MDLAKENRTTGSTNCNSQSSRSHAIFQLKVDGAHKGVKVKSTFSGVLNIIDLAGSERMDKSGVQGEMLKEANCINSGLTTLSRVISALQKKEKYVPYRDSKLTMLLKDYLTEDSKTIMFINIDQDQESLGQTMNSLEFAAKVKKVELKPGVNLAKPITTSIISSSFNRGEFRSALKPEGYQNPNGQQIRDFN